MNECGPDGCAVDVDALIAAKQAADKLEPMDYDAPGTSARETGV